MALKSISIDTHWRPVQQGGVRARKERVQVKGGSKVGEKTESNETLGAATPGRGLHWRANEKSLVENTLASNVL